MRPSAAYANGELAHLMRPDQSALARFVRHAFGGTTLALPSFVIVGPDGRVPAKMAGVIPTRDCLAVKGVEPTSVGLDHARAALNNALMTRRTPSA